MSEALASRSAESSLIAATFVESGHPMASVSQTLNEIREEMRELRLLYKELVNKLAPVEEATKEEKRAIKQVDEVASEEELMKALAVHSRD